MFCPKCGDVELEPVSQDKLEYFACINGCEGVWVGRPTLEKYWGKKKLKQLETTLEEVKQPDFEGDVIEAEKDPLDFDESIDEEFDEENEEEFDDFEDELDEEEAEEEEVEEIVEEVPEQEEENEEDDDEDVEEIDFNDQRNLRISFINEDGEYDDPVTENSEGFTDSELIEDDDDEPLQIEEEETFFLTSPVSGNPMKRFTFPVKDKIKCNIGQCTESDSFWIDGSDEVLTLLSDKKQAPKNFAELLNYERPEEEVFEDEDEDEDEEV